MRNAIIAIVVVAACGGRTRLNVSDAPTGQDTREQCLAPNELGARSLAADSPTTYCGRGTTPGACPLRGEQAYGQDGDYQIRVASYSINRDTITDSVTLLTWERSPPDLETSLPEASARCRDLAIDDKHDWRLPTRLELVSILDYGRAIPGAPPFVYPADGHASYWPSAGGHVDADGTAAPTRIDPSGLSRCVRGNPFEQGYVSQRGNTTIFDPKTGLEWQVADAEPMIWEDALATCARLRLAGACDWRLPSVKELYSIVDDPFPGAVPDLYASSTIVASSAGDGEIWLVHFGTGAADPFDADTPARVRCVR